jgi:hypothetical protein
VTSIPYDLTTDVAQLILAMEHAALERWGNGDPSGFLDISASDVTYFDPFAQQRIDGWEALADYYALLLGKIRFDSFEILNPRVAGCAEMAVLAFNFASSCGNDRFAWNCSEVYRLQPEGWKIIHTHWSMVRPLPSA